MRPMKLLTTVIVASVLAMVALNATMALSEEAAPAVAAAANSVSEQSAGLVETVIACVSALIVVARAVAEALLMLAKVLKQKEQLGKVAALIANAAEFLGRVIGWIGVGTPKAVIAAKVEKAVAAKASDQKAS